MAEWHSLCKPFYSMLSDVVKCVCMSGKEMSQLRQESFCPMVFTSKVHLNLPISFAKKSRSLNH